LATSVTSVTAKWRHCLVQFEWKPDKVSGSYRWSSTLREAQVMRELDGLTEGSWSARIAEVLSQLGDDGWELVAVDVQNFIASDGAGTRALPAAKNFYFKRLQ
jgi:hypothetical protein